MPGTLIDLQHRIGPMEIVTRPALTTIHTTEDAFTALTATGPQFGGPRPDHALGILSGRLEMTVASAAAGELWFTFRVTAVEGNGTLNFLSVPLPGLYYRDGQMFAGSFRPARAGRKAPVHDASIFTYDGLRVSFNLYAPGEKFPGISEGQSSRTYFIRTTATQWVSSGFVEYRTHLGNSGIGTIPGGVRAPVPFFRDDYLRQLVDGPVRIFGGIAQGGGGIIWPLGGPGQPVPPPRPVAIAQRLGEHASLHEAATAWAAPALAETIHHEIQRELKALADCRLLESPRAS